MKKYALISSILTISMISNCMKKEQSSITTFQQAQLTKKAQERIDLEPTVSFSLKDEEIQELRTLLKEKNQISACLGEIRRKVNDEQTPLREILAINIEEVEKQKNYLTNLTNQLDPVQRSKSFQSYSRIITELKESQLAKFKQEEITLKNQLKLNHITKDEYDIHGSVLNKLFSKEAILVHTQNLNLSTQL